MGKGEMAKQQILIVDDQPEILGSLERLLRDEYRVFLAPNGEKGLEILKKQDISVILADQRMPKMTGVEMLSRSLDIRPDAVRILITAYADLEATVAAVNKGRIFYYISKPWEPDELLLIVRRAAEQYDLKKENQRLTRELKTANERLRQENILLKQSMEKEYDFSNLIGHSPAMLSVFKLASKVMDTPTTVLLLGETGTGKEMLARAIHANSGRKLQLFVAQNCGALPDTLLESELFGHVKGAFTGAVSGKKGIFEAADRGTVFLDEIADMSPAMQQRLLRVLQEGEIKPVGSPKTIRVDVRVIAATNKSLDTEMKAGRFREDLYYRLHVFPITLPPLRDRKEDIPDLVRFFIRQYTEKIGKTITGVDPEVLRTFQKASWPGNIRELENELERAVTLADSGTKLTLNHLSPRFQKGGLDSHFTDTESEALKDRVEQLEIQLIRSALKETGGNILKTAGLLQLSRAGLHKKISRYGIDPHQL